MPHDKHFLRALHHLVFVADRHKLPTPISLGWRRESPIAPAAIEVQVTQADFAAWHALLTDA